MSEFDICGEVNALAVSISIGEMPGAASRARWIGGCPVLPKASYGISCAPNGADDARWGRALEDRSEGVAGRALPIPPPRPFVYLFIKEPLAR